jgi:hypothetical protein|tara:strand:+ start:445 stop:1320 length:876 start_codon:yes stop_codon:yes gene_type:complete
VLTERLYQPINRGNKLQRLSGERLNQYEREFAEEWAMREAGIGHRRPHDGNVKSDTPQSEFQRQYRSDWNADPKNIADNNLYRTPEYHTEREIDRLKNFGVNTKDKGKLNPDTGFFAGRTLPTQGGIGTGYENLSRYNFTGRAEPAPAGQVGLTSQYRGPGSTFLGRDQRGPTFTGSELNSFRDKRAPDVILNDPLAVVREIVESNPNPYTERISEGLGEILGMSGGMNSPTEYGLIGTTGGSPLLGSGSSPIGMANGGQVRTRIGSGGFRKGGPMERMVSEMSNYSSGRR